MNPKKLLALITSVALVGLFAPTGAQAAQATIIGQLSNFDTFNDTGVEAHGFEIELEGVHSADVQYFFGAPYNRYGTPSVTEFNEAGRWGARVRWTASWDGTAYSATTAIGPTNPNPTDGHSCYLLGPAGATQQIYDASGCEHFGIGTWGTPTATAYHWLVDDGTRSGKLTYSGTTVSIPAPVWKVAANGNVAAALPALPPAPVAALPGLPACALWGEAQWMKIYKTEAPEPAQLGALLTDSTDVPQEAAEVETEWQFLQGRPTCDESGVPLADQPENELVNEAAAGANAESVTRRYEFFEYTGTYDDTDGGHHEALPLCDSNPYKLTCTGPAHIEANSDLGPYLGAQMAAANLQRLGVATPQLALAKSGNGTGVVTDGGGLTCGDLCSGRFASGASVTLTAVPDAGSRVAGWSVAGCGTSSTCTITVTQDVTMTVQFSTGASRLAPRIDSLSTTSGPAGTQLTIRGGELSDPLQVSLNGTPADVLSASDTAITISVPCNAGQGAVEVTTDGGTTAGPSFTETQSKPSVKSLSAKSSYPGTSVTVTGTGLRCVSTVKVLGQSATFAVLSDTLITLTVPAVSGAGIVAVTNRAGTANSTTFTVLQPPTVTALSAHSGLPGSSITATGTNLKVITKVRIGDSSAKFKAGSTTSMTVTIPAGAVSGDVTFTGPTGTFAFAHHFTVLAAAPTVTSSAPASGPVGTTISIKGKNFSPGTTVRVGGIELPTVYVSPTLVLASVESASASGTVTVTNAGGTTVSPTGFTVTAGSAKRTITKLSSASASVGSAITITGTNLAGMPELYLGDIAVPFRLTSATTALAGVPAGATSGVIRGLFYHAFWVSGPQLSVSAGHSAPTITKLSALAGTPGDLIKVTGTNLAGLLTATFAGIDADVMVTGVGALTVTIPHGAASGHLVITTAGGSATSGFITVN